MSEIKKGYKVLSKHGNSLYSAFDGANSVRYKENEWAMPDEYGGPLCVFDKLKDARSFQYRYDLSCVYECEYIPSSYNEIWQQRSIQRGWVVLTNQYESAALHILPSGTRLAKKVKILKRCEI
jgi:hypothetical protein